MSPSLYADESTTRSNVRCKDHTTLHIPLLEEGRASTLKLATDSQHCKAARNLKIFLFWFLVFDVITVATYGHQTWMDFTVSDVDHSKVEVEEASNSLILEGMVTIFFSFDVILASALWWYVWSAADEPEWEEMASLIHTNLVFNSISFLVLACQRLFHARHDDRLMLPVLVYLCIRARKLRRLGQLKRQVDYASSHSDEPSRYDDLLKAWAPETDTRVERCMLATTLTSVVLLVITLAVAASLDAPSFVTTTVLPSADNYDSAVHPMFLVEQDNHLKNAASGMAAGAGMGAAVSEIAGPEALPLGAAVGGLIGGVAGLLDPW